MKSILIEKPNQLAIVEREIPTPSAGEVRVKVKLAGICGSDNHHINSDVFTCVELNHDSVLYFRG